jgi:iron(II)-dependent oxidoreductase
MKSSDLISMLTDARRRTLDLISDLTPQQMSVPRIDIINPPVWELGHVAWFQEKWARRQLSGGDSIHPQADAFFDSASVAHDTRWELPLPSREETTRYMQDVLEHVVARLERHEATPEEAYFHWLAAMHEDMHGEALAYTRQTLGYAAPKLTNGAPQAPAYASQDDADEDVFVPGGRYYLGAEPGECFVFDNEKWAHRHEMRPFAIARATVTNGQFAAFVDDGGYHREQLWSAEGWEWRKRSSASAPVYWIADGSGWLVRHFDQVAPLDPALPVIHMNWFEADAYCRWAKRRLPSEAEWELAATGMESRQRFPWGADPPTPARANLDGCMTGTIPAAALPAGESVFGCRQMIGNVWEWTATDFLPYPGFVVDPYKEYSEPWFGSERKVLRGGCWATRARLISNTWRNYFTKERRDIFAGFRTCAL